MGSVIPLFINEESEAQTGYRTVKHINCSCIASKKLVLSANSLPGTILRTVNTPNCYFYSSYSVMNGESSELEMDCRAGERVGLRDCENLIGHYEDLDFDS